MQPNAWYAVLPSTLLDQRGVYACRIHDSEVVLWRDAQGCPQAVRDIHPDRAEPLRPQALQTLVREHDAEDCRVVGPVRYSIPARPVLSEHRLQQLPVAEGFGQLWLWSGPEPARPEGVQSQGLGPLSGAPA
ncbi:MAG: hypothetical protein VX899_17470 [Myxococcota bacterium]|nr:hypothetical protein [Myxococcota bacterium]